MDEPKKWHEVYPYGSKAGDEEAKVFRALSRNKKVDFRSTAAVVKATGLSRERVEEIIDKYATKVQPPLIYAHPTNEDHWGYWEKVPEMLKKDDRGIAQKDRDSRIDKQLSGASDVVFNDLKPTSHQCMTYYSDGYVGFVSNTFESDIRQITHAQAVAKMQEQEDAAFFQKMLFEPLMSHNEFDDPWRDYGDPDA